MHPALLPRHHIAIDCETGGLYPSINPILSIGAACSWGNQRILIYVLPQPGLVIEPKAVEKNGYTPELWAERGAIALAEAMTLLCSWLAVRLEEQPEARMLAHGTPFDRGFLEEAARITSWTLPGRHSWRDSMTLFGEVMDLGLVPQGEASLQRLGELSGYWPEGQRPEVHEALDDALACLHGHAWLRAVIRDQEAVLNQLYLTALKDRHRMESLLLQEHPENRGAALIANERARQIMDEGFSPERDDVYANCELLKASSAYTWAVYQRSLGLELTEPPNGWPWGDAEFKPRCDLRDLARAGALLAAHIDLVERRLARKEAEALPETPTQEA